MLQNASKFTPAAKCGHGPDIQRQTAGVEDLDQDTDVGIEPKHLEKVFDAFEQVGMQRERLALGLAISKAIVEMHSGTIRVESEGLGKGARFLIELRRPRRSIARSDDFWLR